MLCILFLKKKKKKKKCLFMCSLVCLLEACLMGIHSICCFCGEINIHTHTHLLSRAMSLLVITVLACNPLLFPIISLCIAQRRLLLLPGAPRTPLCMIIVTVVTLHILPRDRQMVESRMMKRKCFYADVRGHLRAPWTPIYQKMKLKLWEGPRGLWCMFGFLLINPCFYSLGDFITFLYYLILI